LGSDTYGEAGSPNRPEETFTGGSSGKLLKGRNLGSGGFDAINGEPEKLPLKE